MLDIDNFKAYNDALSHVSGDHCLKQVAKIISDSASRAADLTARYGGEEFACILPATDSAGALGIAERIRQDLAAIAIPHPSSPTAEYVTVSIGFITARCRVGTKAKDLIKQADKLLYKAKSLGRNRVEFAAPDATTFEFSERTNSPVTLIWKNDFYSGNAIIDSQHQALFHLCNEVLKAIFDKRKHKELSTMMAKLLEDIAQHFQDEEAILKKVGFPGVKQHAKLHATLLEKCARQI